MLALRYLNPLRTHVSLITIISLLGVSMGVMVLLVVLSVMAGFEDLVKSRVLGQSPHITMQRQTGWSSLSLHDPETGEEREISAEDQWRQDAEKLASLPSVVSANALVQDYVILDHLGSVVPLHMRGVDMQDRSQVDALIEITIQGDADMGMGNVATISSHLSEQMGLQVGSMIQIMSNRNLGQLKPLLDRQESPSAYEQYSELFENTSAFIKTDWIKESEREKAPTDSLPLLLDSLASITAENIYEDEKELINELLETLWSEDRDALFSYYDEGSQQHALDLLAELRDIDIEALREEESTKIHGLALPQDIEVVAIYQADRYAPGPPLLLPLNLAQELAGDEEGGVNGLSLRLKDPYLAAAVLEEEIIPILNELGSPLAADMRGTHDWHPVTWMEAYKEQFSLISQQKILMIFALSFIILVAVFSIGAVMFTVTIQKKREIGVMKALGATPGQVVGVFSMQGLIVGGLGALVGTGLSFLVLKNLKGIQDAFDAMGFNPFSSAYFGMDTLPHIINPIEIIAVCLGAFILCTLAAYVPAWNASRSDAARSLRNM